MTAKEFVKEKYLDAQKFTANYEVIGITDGHKYIQNKNLQKIALERTKKFIDFLEVLFKTQPEVLEIIRK